MPRRTRQARRALPAVIAAGVLLLGACSSDDSSGGSDTTAASSAPETVTETVTVPGQPDGPSPTAEADSGGAGGGGAEDGSGDGCSGLTGKQAVERWYEDVPLPEQGYPYAPGAATQETYDPCAALSSIVIPVAHETVSSPTQVMLFHNGRYIGTATEKAYGYYPDIERLADDELRVTWRWPQGDDANADPTGRSTATFTWDASSESVVMSGEVPPV